MHRLFQNAEGKLVVPPVSITAEEAANASFDCGDAEAVTVLIAVGALTNTKALNAKVQESDDDGDADAYADIAGAALTEITGGAAATNALYAIEIDRTKAGVRERYIDVIVTAGAGATALVCAVAIAHRLGESPANATAAGLAQHIKV